MLGAYAAWTGWQYWERRQSAAASVLYDEMSRSVQAGDVARVERTLSDMKDKFGNTAYAAQSGLMAAKMLLDKGKTAEAKAALTWVADKAPNDGLKSSARLRLASLLVADKAYDDAIKLLSGSFPASFVPLAADRRGDVLLLQGKRDEAATEYGKAYQGLTADTGDYRRLVGMKLNALGIDPDAAPKGARS